MISKTLHLHIGLHKTGTTSLQAHLFEARYELLSHRVLLVAGDMVPGAAHEMARGPGGRGEFCARHLAETVRDQFEANPGMDSLIMSSEEFGDRLLNDATCDALINAFARAVPDVRIVIHVTLRRQDDLIESVISEKAKTVRQGSISDGAIECYMLDHRERLRRLRLHFGEANVRITTTGEAMHAPFTLMQPDPDAPRLNVSPHRRQTMFMAQIPKRDRALVDHIREVMLDGDRVEDDQRRHLISPGARGRLMVRHHPGNRQVEQMMGREDTALTAWRDTYHEDWHPAEIATAGERRGVWLDCARKRPWMAIKVGMAMIEAYVRDRIGAD